MKATDNNLRLISNSRTSVKNDRGELINKCSGKVDKNDKK